MAAASNVFRFYRLRFHFESADTIHYPPGRNSASNIIRGALGSTLRNLACTTMQCHSAKTCAHRASCAYARIFEPSAVDSLSTTPSGLQDHPRPFVLRAMHLDGQTIRPGGRFSFELNLFLTDDPPLEHLILAFCQLAESGLGPSRGRVRLADVDILQDTARQADRPLRILSQGRITAAAGLPPPIELPLPALDDAPLTESPIERLRVLFLTPMEIKQNGQIARRPEFSLLITRIAERINNLAAIYGGPDGWIAANSWPWRKAIDASRQIDLVHFQIEDIAQSVRFSSKTRQTHPIGGFSGEAIYSGHGLRRFLPLLDIARYTGVGRHTVWGNGVLETDGVLTAG